MRLNQPFLSSLAVAVFVAALAGCAQHQTMQHRPTEYARLRNIQLLAAEPNRLYQVVATVTGYGGRYTAKETMLNEMIDEAKKSGADALIPMEFPASPPRNIVDAYVVVEEGRAMTKGRAIKWEADSRWQQ